MCFISYWLKPFHLFHCCIQPDYFFIAMEQLSSNRSNPDGLSQLKKILVTYQARSVDLAPTEDIQESINRRNLLLLKSGPGANVAPFKKQIFVV
jgi:hypothetical protein